MRLKAIFAATVVSLLLIPVAIQLQSTSGYEQPPTASGQNLLVALAAPQAQDDDDGEGGLSKFMQQKLDASTRILEGLMVEDFELIEKHADTLLDMSKEEAWRASNDMMYLQHSTQFRAAVDDLRIKARKKSTEGASLAWVNVTLSCIKCHEWVRNIMLAESDVVPLAR